MEIAGVDAKIDVWLDCYLRHGLHRGTLIFKIFHSEMMYDIKIVWVVGKRFLTEQKHKIENTV